MKLLKKKRLIKKCTEITPFLPVITQILADRVNCEDLEGILKLPEVMRPPPS